MTTINEALLKKYKPFGQLDSQLLRFFVKEAKVRTLRAGEYMLKVGDATGDSYYLLQGEVEMKAGDGRRRRHIGQRRPETGAHPHLLRRAGLVLPVEEHPQMLEAYRRQVAYTDAPLGRLLASGACICFNLSLGNF